MPDYKITVGNAEVLSLTDGADRAPATTLFPNVALSEWDAYPGLVGDDGKVDVNFGSFVIRSQGKTILVDTGWGKDYPGVLMDELSAKGVSIEEIEIVAITHLHIDHVGWNITEENGAPRLTFPNATYYIPKADYDTYNQDLENNAHMVTQVNPLESLGAMVLADSEVSLTSEVTMVPTPGHTPGHMSLGILSDGVRGYILGDVINFAPQTNETHWEIIFDTDHAQARQTREVVLERLLQDGSVIGMGHYMPPSFGRLIRKEGRRLWQVI